MQCICRNCKAEYNNKKARGDYTGFCSVKCQHEKAKELGYVKLKYKKGPPTQKRISEYTVLVEAECIGDVPTVPERKKLLKELKSELDKPYSNSFRVQHIKVLLSHKL